MATVDSEQNRHRGKQNHRGDGKTERGCGVAVVAEADVVVDGGQAAERVHEPRVSATSRPVCVVVRFRATGAVGDHGSPRGRRRSHGTPPGLHAVGTGAGRALEARVVEGGIHSRTHQCHGDQDAQDGGD